MVSAQSVVHRLAAFHLRLNETVYVEDGNVAIEYRAAAVHAIDSRYLRPSGFAVR